MQDQKKEKEKEEDECINWNGHNRHNKVHEVEEEKKNRKRKRRRRRTGEGGPGMYVVKQMIVSKVKADGTNRKRENVAAVMTGNETTIESEGTDKKMEMEK